MFAPLLCLLLHVASQNFVPFFDPFRFLYCSFCFFCASNYSFICCSEDFLLLLDEFLEYIFNIC